MKEKCILVITTGGTIDSVSGGNGLSPGDAPSPSGQDIINFASNNVESCRVELKELFKLDSSNIQPEEWQALATEIDANRSSFEGIIITHGTDTLAYTSSMLSYMLQGIDIPVVLTGSQLPIGNPLTDAYQNLHTAFQMALSERPGIYVAFNRKIIYGTRAVKARTYNFDAFESINLPPVATVDARGLVFDKAFTADSREYSFKPKLSQDVFLLKLIPGTSPEIIDFLIEKGYKGLVIETFGAGGLHTLRRNLVESLRRATDKGLIAVVISQCLYEPSDFSLYEVGRQALTAGVVEGRDMTSESAVTKLMWALGNLGSSEEIRKFFETSVANETSI